MILIDKLIQDETIACPYCGTETAHPCCGEIHSETAYVYHGEIVLESEVTEILDSLSLRYIKELVRYYQYEIERWFYWKIKRKLKKKLKLF